MSSANQPRDVAFRRVIRHAAHRHGLALFAIARGQSDLQQARGHLRIVVEKLVEISQPEKQQRLRMLLLDGVILPQQWRSGLSHERGPGTGISIMSARRWFSNRLG